MRNAKLWRYCMVAAMSFAVLLADSPAYAGEAADTPELKAAAQNEQVQWTINRKEAAPRKLKDGNTEKDLYEITVKDDGSERRFAVNGVADRPDYMPCLLAADGSRFCITKRQGGALLPEIIEGTVDGSDLEVLFEYPPAGAGIGGEHMMPGNASYCDMYAKTKDGKPISGLSLEYDASQHGDISGGLADMILYDTDLNIKGRTKLDGYGTFTSGRGMNGYTQLTVWGSDQVIGQEGQLTPYIGGAAGFRQVYAILDDSGKIYENNYGDNNRFIRAFKTDGSEEKFTVLDPNGKKVADVTVCGHETDYYSTSAVDFDYDYEVENLADGWEISVDMSETSAFPNSLKTGESLPCEPSLLISITAKRKNDDGLIPASYDFDGRQNLTFRFKGLDGIQEIKEVQFTCSENVQAADGNWLGWVSCTAEEGLAYDLEKGELTFPKSVMSEWAHDIYPSVGNTYQGYMTYIAEDGTEKTAYGEWYIKILEKSEQPLPDDTNTPKPGDTKPDDTKPGNPDPSKPKPDIKVNGIKISGLSHKIAVGKKIALKAAVAPSNATNKSVVWKSNNTKYADVNSKGIVTIKKAGAGKTVTITASAKDGSRKKASYRIICMKGVVKKVAISGQKTPTLKPGKSMKLKAKVTASKGANKTLRWTSSNQKYATVTNSGKVTAKKSGKGKTIKITAMATDGSGKKATVKIRIK